MSNPPATRTTAVRRRQIIGLLRMSDPSGVGVLWEAADEMERLQAGLRVVADSNLEIAGFARDVLDGLYNPATGEAG